MTTWAVLASGPSMSQALAEGLWGRCNVAAVSNTYRLAPWADALVSADAAWWAEHPDALRFAGPKFGAMPEFLAVPGVERIATSGVNSALLACMAAVRLGATRLLLCGLDLHGAHYFGDHPEPLFNPREPEFARFRRQFERYRPSGVEIFNCTPGSTLACYPFANLEEMLCS